MRGISRTRAGRASWIVVAALACGGRAPSPEQNGVGPAGVRIVPSVQALVLESSGPPVADTSVTFTTGEPRVIVLRHGPPDKVAFAEVAFPPTTFADSGRPVRVDLAPHEGVYGLDIRVSLPLAGPASLTFKYGRYFKAPRAARAAYGNDVLLERALSIARVLSDSQLALLPSTRPASDNLQASFSESGTYFAVAHP
jgi:hypothetical protein